MVYSVSGGVTWVFRYTLEVGLTYVRLENIFSAVYFFFRCLVPTYNYICLSFYMHSYRSRLRLLGFSVRDITVCESFFLCPFLSFFLSFLSVPLSFACRSVHSRVGSRLSGCPFCCRRPAASRPLELCFFMIL